MNSEDNKDNKDNENNKNIKVISTIPQKYIKLHGVIKKFNEAKFNKYDIPARQKIKERLGDLVKDNPDEYKQDLLLNLDNCKYKYIEVQVCINWIKDKYPHNYPSVYERKICYGYDTLFITLSRNLDKGILFDRESLNKTPKRLKRYAREFIYEVPWNRAIEFYTDQLDADTILFY